MHWAPVVPSGGAQTSEDIELDRQAGKFELKPDHSLSGANCGHRELCSRHQEDTAHLCVNSVLRPVWEALPTNPEASKIPLQASWCMIRWAAFAPAKREEQDRELLPWGIRGHSLSLKDTDLHIHVLISSCHCPGGSQVPHNSAKDQRLS